MLSFLRGFCLAGMTWFLTSLSLVVLSFMQVESIDSIFCMSASFSAGVPLVQRMLHVVFRMKKTGFSFNSGYAGSQRILHIYSLDKGWLQ